MLEWHFITTATQPCINVKFDIKNLSCFPLLIVIDADVAIINVIGTSVTESLSTNNVNVNWLTGESDATIFAKLDDGYIRIKLVPSETTSGASMMIKALRSDYPVIDSYMST